MLKKQNSDFYTMYELDRCEPLINAVASGQLDMHALCRNNYPGIELPDHILPGVCSVGYWDTKRDQTWGLDWHRNEGIEFTFLESGSLYFSTKNEIFNLNPGNFTTTRPWQLHKVGNPHVSRSKLYWFILDVGAKQPHQSWKWPEWIILSKEDLMYLTQILRENEVQVWKSDKKLQDCFRELGHCLDNSSSEIPQSKLTILINNLLLEMFLQLKTGEVQLNEALTMNLRTVEIFFDHLKNDYEKPWSLDTMAEHCGLGKTSLTKYSRQITNMTPMNYLTDIRLSAAVNILKKNKALNIKEICYDCGFSTSQYFSTVFKKRYKCTPSDYAATHQLK